MDPRHLHRRVMTCKRSVIKRSQKDEVQRLSCHAMEETRIFRGACQSMTSGGLARADCGILLNKDFKSRCAIHPRFASLIAFGNHSASVNTEEYKTAKGKTKMIEAEINFLRVGAWQLHNWTQTRTKIRAQLHYEAIQSDCSRQDKMRINHDARGAREIVLPRRGVFEFRCLS